MYKPINFRQYIENTCAKTIDAALKNPSSGRVYSIGRGTGFYCEGIVLFFDIISDINYDVKKQILNDSQGKT